VIRVRESFGAKLLSALLGTVGLLLVVTFLVVRFVTEQQVDAVATRTAQNAERLFEARDEVRREAVSVLARSFLETPRALQRLRAALRDNDLEYLAGDLLYEMDLQDLEDALFVFTDEEGRPALTVIDGEAVFDADPANIQPLAEQLLFGDSLEARGFRVVDGTMYGVQAQYLEFRSRPIGAAALGLPIGVQDVQEVSEVGGFEGCLAHSGRCVVRSAGVDAELEDAMLAAVELGTPLRITSDDSDWSIRAEPLVPGRPSEGHRVVAVPLSVVLAPFESILRALLLVGLGALGMGALLGSAISRSLTRPVRALVDASRRVADGDYETRVSIEARDELGVLASAFNDMTQGLLVREQYRSVLSKVVSRDIAEELMKGDVELGGENREITVLFADIRGFTPLTEGMEPQRVIALLNECMEHLAQSVDAEGGVVDKFIGDEVMAVFGAPVSQPDHSLRAVRAALRMRSGVQAMNRERAERGQGSLDIGIGIASGLAVAGNMGSPDRLNYTVLGSTVNLASRLTSEAGPGQIVISEATRVGAGDALAAVSLGKRKLKGFKSDVEVFAVDDLSEAGIEGRVERSESAAGPTSTRVAGALVLAASVLTGALQPVSAQWPTLTDAGIGYINRDGSVQLDLSGQMHLETFYLSNDEDGLSGLAYGSGVLFAPRVRLFLDTFLGDHVYGLVEWRGDRGEAPTADFWEARLEQAYLRVSSSGGSVSLQGGIFTSPFGSYAQRHFTVVDPFIRPPLPYDYRTVISRRWAPRDESWFTRWRDNPEQWRTQGAPPIWAVPYQWGAMATVGVSRLTFRLAAMNTPPSSEPVDWYEFKRIEDRFSWIGGVDLKVGPELTMGWSYNNGPYIPNNLPNAPEFPLAGTTYDQEMWSLNASFARGPAMLRGEFIHDAWDVPNVEQRAVELGYTLEAQLDVAAGWSVAARFGRIDFRRIEAADVDWDWDVNRLEAALGYRIVRNAGIMATFGRTWNASPVDPAGNQTALRLWWDF